MISLNRLNNSEFYLNPNLIETMEKTPDTIISLSTEKKLVVKNSINEILEKIIIYNRKIFIEKTRIQ